MRSKNRPLLAGLRKRTVTIPGRNGEYDFGGNTYENKLIDFYLGCTTTDREVLADKMKAETNYSDCMELIINNNCCFYLLKPEEVDEFCELLQTKKKEIWKH
jgi:hypothetical protein